MREFLAGSGWVVARKPKRSTLKNKADREFSLRVRARGHCELAGRDAVSCLGNLQTAHIFSRRYHAIRWDEDNALCLCAAHHTFYTHRVELWFLAIEELFPGRWAALRKRINEPWDRDLLGALERIEGKRGA